MGIKGALKKSASGVPCLRRASFAEVATEAESGNAQAGRPFVVLTYLPVRSVRPRGCGLPFDWLRTGLDGPF
jgi:hypothetical protein